MRAFDGLRLLGLCGRRSMAIGKSQVRLRILSPDRLLEVDLSAVRAGVTEYVLRSPESRKLEDRVLDVLRACELAAGKEGIRTHEVLLFTPEREAEPDEFLIAGELIAGETELGAD